MESSCEIIATEIGVKGIGYLIVRKCPRAQLEHTLCRAARVLVSRGAEIIRAASTDPDCPLAEGTAAGLQLTHVHDMLRMEGSLALAPAPAGALRLEPLTRQKGGQYLALHNEVFFSVPNSATYAGCDLERLLLPDFLAGFALLDGNPAGVYELGLGEVPEICSIALCRSARGRGLGRQLLLGAMRLLRDLGYARCSLLVSSANIPAYRLYCRTGFQTSALVSRWFDVRQSAVPFNR